ncbi:MAG: class I SAM-dependent methyltransferase [Candidatus Levybacteria bacterium]|nr:class I SAM-dependent methyltransferase [Candidatus Levybacteria bacterium]
MRLDLYGDLYLQEERHWWHISKRNVVKKMLGAILHNKNIKILDIGCGAGKTMDMLSYFGTIWGLDNNKRALSFCKKRGFRHLVLADAADTGFENDFFDVITMLDVLEHTEKNSTLQETKRILKPRGSMIITVPAYQWLWSAWDEVLKHKKRYTKHDLEETVRKNGFTVVRSSYMYSFLVLPIFIFRKLKSQKNSYESDFSTNPSIINFLFALFSNIERYFVVRGWIPFGTSLILVCKK